MSVEHKFSYKEVETIVELCRPPEKGEIKIVSEFPTEEVLHEVLFMAFMIFNYYRETGEVLSVEDARREVAMQYLTEERYGSMASQTSQDLAKIVGITEELAEFRIQLARE